MDCKGKKKRFSSNLEKLLDGLTMYTCYLTKYYVLLSVEKSNVSSS